MYLILSNNSVSLTCLLKIIYTKISLMIFFFEKYILRRKDRRDIKIKEELSSNAKVNLV